MKKPTETQIRLIRRTLRLIASRQQEFPRLFFDKLFELDPSLRDVLGANLKQHNTRLIRVVAVLVSNIDKDEEFRASTRSLGRYLVDMQPNSSHFALAQHAFLWTVEMLLGKLYTAVVQDAWIAFATAVSQSIQREADSSGFHERECI